MTEYDVVRKLIGPVEPLGESHTDEERFKNLEKLIELVDRLIFDIDFVRVNNAKRIEHSRKKAGVKALKYLDRLKESLDEI